jgi:hypothetical protein
MALSFNDDGAGCLSGAWYHVTDTGGLTYTDLGRSVYAPMFRSAGLSIHAVGTLNDHKAYVKRSVALSLDKRQLRSR